MRERPDENIEDRFDSIDRANEQYRKLMEDSRKMFDLAVEDEVRQSFRERQAHEEMQEIYGRKEYSAPDDKSVTTTIIGAVFGMGIAALLGQDTVGMFVTFGALGSAVGCFVGNNAFENLSVKDSLNESKPIFIICAVLAVIGVILEFAGV